MLASAIARRLAQRGVDFAGVDRDTVDITQPQQVRELFDRELPTLVFNCAAMTNVDGCEADPQAARAVNAQAVLYLAESARRHGARLVHYSTDFVFDGHGERPYRPGDRPEPLSEYGRSKLLGERNLQRAYPDGYLLIRTAWLYGENGKCFPQTMLNAAKSGKPLKVVSDQVGSPTWTGDLADVSLRLVDADTTGIYHVVNSGSTSWYGFTRAIFEEFGVVAEVSEQSSAQWAQSKPDAAHRPAYSVLDTAKTTDAIGQSIPTWREALHQYHKALKSQQR